VTHQTSSIHRVDDSHSSLFLTLEHEGCRDVTSRSLERYALAGRLCGGRMLMLCANISGSRQTLLKVPRVALAQRVRSQVTDRVATAVPRKKPHQSRIIAIARRVACNSCGAKCITSHQNHSKAGGVVCVRSADEWQRATATYVMEFATLRPAAGRCGIRLPSSNQAGSRKGHTRRCHRRGSAVAPARRSKDHAAARNTTASAAMRNAN